MFSSSSWKHMIVKYIYSNIHVYHIFLFVPSINLIFLLKILIIDEIEIWKIELLLTEVKWLFKSWRVNCKDKGMNYFQMSRKGGMHYTDPTAVVSYLQILGVTFVSLAIMLLFSMLFVGSWEFIPSTYGFM